MQITIAMLVMERMSNENQHAQGTVHVQEKFYSYGCPCETPENLVLLPYSPTLPLPPERYVLPLEETLDLKGSVIWARSFGGRGLLMGSCCCGAKVTLGWIVSGRPDTHEAES